MIVTSGFKTALSAPNSFSTGAPVRTPLGELTAPPDCITDLRMSLTFKGEKGERGEREKKVERKGTGGTGPLSQIPGSAPDEGK